MSSRRQYPFDLIEPKWQRAWDAEQTFRAFNPGDSVPAGHPFGARYSLAGKTASAAALPPKFYILDMFPYPSGAGLHVGHPEGYTATDILARYRRAKGFNVLHPMGWDSFGLPAEQYAVKTGQHPRVTTEQNIANFTRQIKSLGFSYDWSCELATTDPEYFRWTQWIFLQLYNSYFDWHWNKATPIALLEDALSDNPTRRHEWQDNPFLAGTHDGYVNGDRAGREEARRRLIEKMRLAYVSEQPVWWCEELGTVLANEEVVDGKSEVGGFPVVRKPMRQWVLRITAYAERLLDDLNTIEWTDSLKEMQRNWIGRSEGAEVDFAIADCRLPIADSKIRVFTTRPDTLFGATYMVLAPEHKLVDHIVPESWPSGTPDAWKGQRKYQPAITAVEATEPGQIAFGMAKVDLTGLVPTPAALQVMTAERALRFRAVPIYYGEGTLIVAISNPADLDMMDSLRHELSVENLEFRVASESDIERILVEFYGAKPSIALSPREAVAAYRTYASGKSDLERTELAKEKTGVFTGAYAINPVNGEKIPIWIADYVLASYGTGAIMAVPAHDERDWEFAQKFGLTIKPVVGSLVPKVRDAGTTNRDEHLRMVVAGKETYVIAFGDCFVGEGIAINSANAELSLHGLPTAEAKAKITAWLEAKGLGKKTINYKLRDWLFSRQRYWGEPFPIVWRRDASGQPYHEALPESALPLLPPALTDYKPTASGEPPLARAKDWVNLPDGAVREVNTMPQWAGSCWYYLRYLDAKNGTAFVSKEAESYWMGAAIGHRPSAIPADGQAAIANGQAKTTPGVDLYVGGTEHAVLHLLYARFWHKVLFDLGHVSTAEPFYKLVNQGLILGEDGQKMSKSRGNVVNPDDVLVEFGADAFRLYEMFMGPLQDTKPWNTRGVEGVYRFLGRVWRLFIEEKSETAFEQAQTVATQPDADLLDHLVMNATISDVVATPAQLKVLHACIKKVTEDLDHLRFNTAISAMMVFVNEANGWQTRPFAVMRTFLQLLAPFAPHLTEELWSRLHSAFGQRAPSLSYAAWPSYDPALLVESEVEVPVSVNGKLRDVIRIAVGADESAHEAAARAAEKVKPLLEGKTVKKVIVKPGKMVNLVVG